MFHVDNVEWVYNYNGKYLVSEFGEIVNVKNGNFLNPTIYNGYKVTSRDISEFGSNSVHRLVYELFIGKIPDGLTVNHIDGNKSNNHYSNFEAITAAENTRHAHQLGLVTYSKGSSNGMAILSEESVLAVYLLLLQGHTNEQISDLYGINAGYVSLIRTGKRWKYLFDEVSMLVTYSMGKLPFDLNRCKHIYKKCVNTSTPQRLLGEELGIDPSTVSRIRTGSTWKYFKDLISCDFMQKQDQIARILQIKCKTP